MDKLFPLFSDNIQRYTLIPSDITVILGFSGGKDSVTLFHLLREFQKFTPFHLILAYFNHRLRNDADHEEEWIRCFAEKNNVELVTGGKNVLEFKQQEKLNLEHAAALSRYRFFREISQRYPGSRVATAHTRSDLTETFLIKLLRGSGLQGLSSIYHKKENTIIRPLLLFPQEEILSFIQRNRLEFYHDYTNDQDNFLRNRIRHRLIPVLEELEPQVHRHVYQTVSIIQAEYDYFSEKSTEILSRRLILDKVLPSAVLADLHPALQRHIIREYVRLIKGNLLDLNFHHIEDIRTLHGEVRGMAIPGVEFKFHKGFIFPSNFIAPGYHYTLSQPETLYIPEIRMRMVCKRVDHFQKPEDNLTAITFFQSLQFPLIVRSPKPGDKYRKINSTVHQKVFEMIRVSGMPSELRNLRPVLENGNGKIIQVAGAPVADEFRVGEDSAESVLLGSPDTNKKNATFLLFQWEPVS